MLHAHGGGVLLLDNVYVCEIQTLYDSQLSKCFDDEIISG